MKEMKLRLTIVVMLFVMLSTALSSAAPAIFTDTAGHWAKEYIEDVYERRLITGYPDSTFKPQGYITKLESIIIVARLMGYSDSEEQYYINQYKQQLKDSKVPDWGQGAVAYALFNDILSEEELQSSVSAIDSTYAKRYEVAVYIGKVLQYGAGEELSRICVIPYKDELSIPNEAKPYIDLLLNKGILDKMSNDERFLPSDRITRAEVAKLVSLSAEILDDVSDDDIIVEPGPITSPPEETVPSGRTLTGYFLYYSPGYGQKPEITVRDSKDNIHNFLFTADSKVYFMNKIIDIGDLSLGDKVIITYVDDEAIEIEAEPKEKKFEGIVKAKNSGKDEDTLEVLLDDKTVETFVITSKATLKRDRKSANFRVIKVGDEIEITTEYDKVISVDAFSIKETTEGYIKEIVIGQKSEITIEKHDGTIETFALTPDTTIRVEEERAGIYDLRLNYEVELEIENCELLWIEAYRRFQGSNYTGKVIYKNAKRGIFELEVKAREEIEIYVDDDTIYIDEYGDQIRFGDIYVGDEIGVFAEDNGYYITAKKVFIIIQR